MRFIMQLGILVGDIAHEYNWVCIFLAMVPLMFFFKMRKRERSWIFGLIAVYPFTACWLIIKMNGKLTTSGGRFVPRLLCFFARADRHSDWLRTDADRRLQWPHHYQRFRPAGLMLGFATLAPALIAFYSGVSDTFYGGVGLPSPQFPSACSFILLAACLALAMLCTAAHADFRSRITHTFTGIRTTFTFIWRRSTSM